MVQIIVKLESALEFVEDDLPRMEVEQIERAIAEVVTIVSRMAATFATGRALREGLQITFAGRPNVGKSSLFNRLAGKNRSIVTEIAGTTRDTISGIYQSGWYPNIFDDHGRHSCGE